ncbi:MAG: DNA-3-methyladenine glycosylase I [Proteobacteria bacterium]|nr:DNA-3-methyladenine glycosylase I [Pseudomonadota bacterium]
MGTSDKSKALHDDGRARCPWVELDKPDYVAYHDHEWGVPIHDDRLLFEYLILEGAQAGLSWYTVLRKREAYRKAFANFEIAKVARYTPAKVEALMADAGLVRNRQKLESALGNARACLALQEEFGSVDAYLWSFVDHRPQVNVPRSRADYRATSPESDRLSTALKRRGFKFVGSTIMYAFMQATGLVNDHSHDCFRQAEVVHLASGH